MTYQHFQNIVKKTVVKDGIEKDVWPYLFRHSQLTNMADKLTNNKLTLFAGWTLGTEMTKRYVHWSGRDLDQNLLAIHGLAKLESSNNGLELTRCPRCSSTNPPSSPRCGNCGLIIDKKMAIEVEDDLMKRLGKLEDLVRGTLNASAA